MYIIANMYVYCISMQDYYRSGRMLVRMAEAIGRLVLAGRDMTRLAGFTARVSELLVVLQDLQKGVYERTMVSNSDTTEEGMGALHKSNGV